MNCDRKCIAIIAFCTLVVVIGIIAYVRWNDYNTARTAQIKELFYTMFYNFFRYRYYPPDSSESDLFKDNINALVEAYTNSIINNSGYSLDYIQNDFKNNISNGTMSSLYIINEFIEKQIAAMFLIISVLSEQYSIPITAKLFNDVYSYVSTKFPGVTVLNCGINSLKPCLSDVEWGYIYSFISAYVTSPHV